MTALEEPPARGPHVGRALKRKEDPRLITGRATYVDDIRPRRHAVDGASCAPPRRTRGSSRSTPRTPLARDDVVGRLHRRGPRRPAGAAADGLGAARRRGQRARALAAGQGRGRATSASRSPWSSARTATPSSTPPSTSSSSTSRCRSSSTRRRRSRTRCSRIHDLSTNKVHEWSLGGGDVDAGFAQADVVIERRVVNHRTAGGAIEPRAVLADYRAGAPDAVVVHADPALPAALPRHHARPQRGPHPRDRARGRRRLRLQAADLRRGDPAPRGPRASSAGRSSGSRRARRTMMVTHHGRDQIATVRDGRQARRHGHRLPREDPRRPRRLP